MNKVAFTIDELNKTIEIMSLKDNVFDYKEYPIPSELLANESDHQKIFEYLIDICNSAKISPATVTFVLPNKYAICDYIEMPAFHGKKLNDMLELEMANRYKQSNLLRTLFIPIEQKKFISFSALSIYKSQIDVFMNTLKQYKFTPHIALGAIMTFYAIASSQLKKHENMIFADIKQHSTEIIAIKNSCILGFTTITHEKSSTNSQNQIDRIIMLLEEYCDMLNKKYYMNNISIKYNSSYELPKDIFPKPEKIKFADPFIAKAPELYGALLLKNSVKRLIYE